MKWMGDVMSRDEDGRKTPEECLVRGSLQQSGMATGNFSDGVLANSSVEEYGIAALLEQVKNS
jgi:hypothetical protein